MTEEGSFQFILCARWRSEYYVILGLQFPKDKPCVVSISKPFSAVMNVSPPPALVCMQIARLIKLTKGPALLNRDMEPALCLPADSKSISPLELAAFSWFCVFNQGPFPGKHSNMSNRWRALFPKDNCSNPIIWAILKETGHIVTSSGDQSHVKKRMEWSAWSNQAWSTERSHAQGPSIKPILALGRRLASSCSQCCPKCLSPSVTYLHK